MSQYQERQTEKLQGCPTTNDFITGIDNTFLFFVCAFTILTVLDFLTTSYGIQNGLAREVNIIIGLFASNYWLFLLIKVIGISIVIYLSSQLYDRNIKAAKYGMTIIITMMSMTVINNLYVIGVL